MKGSPRIFISVGEVSGDIVAARVIAEILRRAPDAFVFGTGGRRMREAGASIDSDINDIGVVGVTEVVRILPAVARAYRQIRQRVLDVGPDVALLIGNDAFNVILARWLKRHRIPTVSYFPPQVWLWRSLIGPIARSFDAIVASFPAEYESYARARADAAVSFAGHYLASELQPAGLEERREARRCLAIADGAQVIGLFPGSRRNEVSLLTPLLLDAAARLADRDAALRFVLATTEATEDGLGRLLAGHPMASRVRVSGNSHTVMRSADLLLLASGTASLEAALLGTPMIIVYKVSAITNMTARLAIRLGLIEKYEIGLPNLILGHPAVPEILQERATGPNVAEEAWALLSSEGRMDAMRKVLLSVSQQLRGSHPAADVAEIVMHWAARRSTADATPISWSAESRAALPSTRVRSLRPGGTAERR